MTHPRLFLSHCSADRVLASELYEVLCSARVVSRDQVFFSEEKAGRSGEPFSRAIFDALAVADVVLALLTPRSLNRPAVMAEMSVAHARGQASGASVLRLLAVPAAYGQEKFPFNTLTSTRADSTKEVSELLLRIAADLGTSGQVDAQALAKGAAGLVKLAKGLRYRWRPSSIQRAAAGLALVAAAAAVFPARDLWWRAFSHRQVVPAATQADRENLYLIYAGSFPKKRLTRRLRDIQIASGEAPHEDVAKAFNEALGHAIARKAFGAFGPADLEPLMRIVARWNGKVETDDKECKSQEQEVDVEWCKAVAKIFTGDKGRLFDEVPLAVLGRQSSNGKLLLGGAVAGANLTVAEQGYKVTCISPGSEPAVFLRRAAVSP